VCGCENGAACDGITGQCKCPAGFMGVTCNQCLFTCCCLLLSSKSKQQQQQHFSVCPEGKFGVGCKEKCRCANGAKCDARSGECTCNLGFVYLFTCCCLLVVVYLFTCLPLSGTPGRCVTSRAHRASMA